MTVTMYEKLNRDRGPLKETIKVGAYCRVSTDKDDQANSFENQQLYFREYIDRHPDWELRGIFADEGITGTNTKKRKEFNRMIACAKNGDIDLIMTKEISRFARNTLDSIYYTRELRKIGVGVLFLNDNINTLDPDAELRLTIMSSIAQEESRKTSERVKWGQKRQMEKGVVFGRSMLGYDVKGGRMIINEEGAKIVHLIFDKFVNEGKGTHVIARELREAGITTQTNMQKWSNTVILRVLRNEKYCGDLVQKKTFTPDYLSHEKKYNRGEEEFVIIENHHEPIVSKEIFGQAKTILDGRAVSQERKAKYSNRYAFSGKIKCGLCGATCVSRYKKRKDDSIYKSWRCCQAAKNGRPRIDKAGNQVGCLGQCIRNEDAIHIMGLICKALKVDKTLIVTNMIRIIRSVICADTGINLENLKGKIAQVEGKRTKLVDIYISGNITKEEFLNARAKCEAESAEIQDLIESVEKKEMLMEQHRALMGDIEHALNEMVSGITHDDVFYRNILNKMVVHDKDHIDVYLNLLPFKWRYAVAKASKKNTESQSESKTAPKIEECFQHGTERVSGTCYVTERSTTDTDIPISVSIPLARLVGML